MTRGVDLLLCAWFVLCAAAFWGAYVGFALTPGISNALYALFLLTVIAIVAVRWLRGRTAAEKAARETAGPEAMGEIPTEGREREDD